MRGYVAWQKWERDKPLSAEDVLALGLSPESPLLRMKQVPKAKRVSVLERLRCWVVQRLGQRRR